MTFGNKLIYTKVTFTTLNAKIPEKQKTVGAARRPPQRQNIKLRRAKNLRGVNSSGSGRPVHSPDWPRYWRSGCRADGAAKNEQLPRVVRTSRTCYRPVQGAAPGGLFASGENPAKSVTGAATAGRVQHPATRAARQTIRAPGIGGGAYFGHGLQDRGGARVNNGRADARRVTAIFGQGWAHFWPCPGMAGAGLACRAE